MGRGYYCPALRRAEVLFKDHSYKDLPFHVTMVTKTGKNIAKWLPSLQKDRKSWYDGSCVRAWIHEVCQTFNSCTLCCGFRWFGDFLLREVHVNVNMCTSYRTKIGTDIKYACTLGDMLFKNICWAWGFLLSGRWVLDNFIIFARLNKPLYGR